MTGPAWLTIDRAGAGLAGAVRVGLGALWLHEGIVKYRAGFGRADIELVVMSATGNPRVPGYFDWFARNLLSPLDGVVGVVVPATETVLGLALILGVCTLTAAVAGIGLLMMYWSADQLITEYPIMVVLTVVVVLAGPAAARYSVPDSARALFRRWPGGRQPSAPGAARRSRRPRPAGPPTGSVRRAPR